MNNKIAHYNGLNKMPIYCQSIQNDIIIEALN